MIFNKNFCWCVGGERMLGFFFFSSVSLDTPLTEVFLGSQRPRKILFVFKRLAAVARMGKHLAKPDATPCSSLNNQSPFSEMKTEVCNDVMDCYRPKTEPVPVPRKSISEKKLLIHFYRRASDTANLKWFTQSSAVKWLKQKKKRKMFTLAYYAAVLKVRESLERGEVKASVLL